MDEQVILEDIFSILKNKVKKEYSSEYILGNFTCSSMEVVYLFVVINKKYNVDMNVLCNSLDDYLTIEKLAHIIMKNGEL